MASATGLPRPEGAASPPAGRAHAAACHLSRGAAAAGGRHRLPAALRKRADPPDRGGAAGAGCRAVGRLSRGLARPRLARGAGRHAGGEVRLGRGARARLVGALARAVAAARSRRFADPAAGARSGAGRAPRRSDRARRGQDAGAGAGQRARDDAGRHPHRRRAWHRGRLDRQCRPRPRHGEAGGGGRGAAGRAGGDAARTRAAQRRGELGIDQPHHAAPRVRRRPGGGGRPRAGRGAGVAHATQHRADAVQQAPCA